MEMGKRNARNGRDDVMKLVIDIDNTICTQEKDYSMAKPFLDRIASFNKLYNEGHIIVYYTARGTETGTDWREVTEKQFRQWGVKYHDLIFGKPSADFYIDDKGVTYERWEQGE